MQNVLSAADKSSWVKKVVVTGSLVATMRIPQDLFSGRTISEEDLNPITVEEAEASPLTAYQYSKVYAEQMARKYMKEQSRGFDLIVVLAPTIVGKSRQKGFKPENGNLRDQPSLHKSTV